MDEYYGIKILKNGTWLYQGTPIGRHNLVKLFASVLKRDENGDYWLVTPAERGRIEVEDVPFVAVELTTSGEGRDGTVSFRTNLDDWVTVGADHPLRVVFGLDGAPSPYILVRDNLEARLSRAVYYELAELAMRLPPQNGNYGIWSQGRFFTVGKATE